MKKNGFTLLELMVVVSIIGILAATAIPMMSKYLKRAKTSEAVLNLRKIYDGEVSYFQEEHSTPTGAVVSKQFVFLPPQPPFPPESKKRFGNFSKPEWEAIKFGADGPTYYSYMADVFPTQGVNPQPAGIPPLPSAPPNVSAAAVVRAMGDLDGNGKFSLFERIVSVEGNDDQPVGFAGVYMFDELE